MFNMSDLNSAASDLCRETARQTEDIILDQLNEFISRGLIVVERGPMTLTQNSHTDKIMVNQSISLKLKDQEYIAGFFDGEGSIGVYASSGKNNSYHLRTQLTQNKSTMSTFLLYQLAEQYGGNISMQKTLSGNIKYNWQLNSFKASDFLNDMYPYLLGKKDQALVAIQWQKNRPAIIRNSKGQIQAAFPPDLQLNKDIAELIKLLKNNDLKGQLSEDFKTVLDKINKR